MSAPNQALMEKALAVVEEIDLLCDEFESGVRADEAPRIEDFLKRQCNTASERLFAELLGIEIQYGRRRDKPLSREGVVARFPQYTQLIRRLFDDASGAGDSQATVVRDGDTIDATLPAGAIRGGTQPVLAEVPQFGDYELLEEIGRGGMGVVYQAKQLKLDRLVALKMIRSGELATDDEVARFYAEAESAAKLDHPHIVPVYDVGEHGGQRFFSMGFVDGHSLSDQLRDGPLSPKEAARLVQTIAQAVHYAHQQGIVHRDLKPANVLIDQAGQPRITDFGLAKRIDDDQGMTQAGQVLGTPGYMPPEQANGDSNAVGPHSDVYSLGAVLYALLIGRPPFHAATVMETLDQVRNREPVALRQFNPAIDKDLETICLKCLEKEPQSRYSTAEQLSDELLRFLDGRPIIARPLSRPAKTWRWCKRKPVLASLSALLLGAVGALIVGFVLLMASHRRETEARAEAEKSFRNQTAAVHTFFTHVSQSKELLKGTPGTQKLRQQLLEQARNYYKEFVEQHANDESLRADLAKAHANLGFIEAVIGEKEKAVAALLLAIDIYQQLADDNPAIVKYRSELAEAYGNLGAVHRQTGQPEESLAALRKSLKLSKQVVADEPANPEHAADLAAGYTSVGTACYETGKITEALAAQNAARAIYEKLVRDEPANSRYQLGLSETFNAISTVKFVKGESDAALKLLQKSVAIRRKLVEENRDDVELLRSLVIGSFNLGVSAYQVRKLDVALAAYEQAVDNGERLVRENPAVPEYQAVLVRVYSAVGLLYGQLKRPDDAKAAYQQGIGIGERLVARFPDVEEHHTILATIYNNFAVLYGQSGRLADALLLHQKARDSQEQLVRANPEVPEHGNQLTMTCANIGVIQFQLNNPQKALAAFARCIEVGDRLVRENPAVPQYQFHLANCHRMVANHYKQIGNLSLAAASHQNALALRQSLSLAHPANTDYAVRWALCYRDIAAVIWKSHPKVAAAHAKKGVAVLESVLQREPDNAHAKLRLPNAIEIAAEILDLQGRFAEAAEYWRRAVNVADASHKEAWMGRLSSSLARAGEHERAAHRAGQLSKVAQHPGTFYALAGTYALASRAAADDRAVAGAQREKLADRYRSRSLEMLKRAAAVGYFKDAGNARRLQLDPDLNPLRHHDDFRAFAESAGNKEIRERLTKLGLDPDAHDGAEDGEGRLGSALAAISCFPMYMVANVHAWTPDGQWDVPGLNIPGFEHIREAFAIEKQESTLRISKHHRRVLAALLWKARPMDLVMYEYALETLGMCLDECDDDVSDTIRSAVAHMIVKVAQASGEGFFGSGEKISPEERACIEQISKTLDLRGSDRAAEILDSMG
eukprot:g33048.t1